MSVNSFLVSLVLVIVLIAPIFVAPSVQALGCSGSGCNGKDPIYTGCNQNAYLAKRISFREYSNGLALWQVYADVYYSPACGTNWLRVTNNPWGGNAYKYIASIKSGGGVLFAETENDVTYGSSYSMMVYAPGTTPVDVFSKLYDRSGNPKAYIPSTRIY